VSALRLNSNAGLLWLLIVIERLCPGQFRFSSIQQRTYNETRDADVTARVSVVKELLPVLDNFDRAKGSLHSTDEAQVSFLRTNGFHFGAKIFNFQEEIIAYYTNIFAKIDRVLGTYDLRAVPTVGSPFDYNVHEAIQQVMMRFVVSPKPFVSFDSCVQN
jgi:molecular chaperone GrpE